MDKSLEAEIGELQSSLVDWFVAKCIAGARPVPMYLVLKEATELALGASPDAILFWERVRAVRSASQSEATQTTAPKELA